MKLVTRSIPGRIRVRHPALRTDRLPGEIGQLSTLPGVITVHHNKRAGSLLIVYDTARLTESGILKYLNLADSSDGGICCDAEKMSKEAGAMDARLIVKICMVAGLGLTVGAAVFRLRSLHIAGGIFFLAAVGGHVLLTRDPASH